MYLVRNFQSPGELEDYLNGVILSAKAFSGAFAESTSLDALTLIVDAGGGDVTVTFSGASLTLNAVVGQINDEVAGAASIRNYGRSAPSGSNLAFILGGLIIKSTGTANALLGLSTTDDKTVTPIVKTDIISVTVDANQRMYSVLHEA